MNSFIIDPLFSILQEQKLLYLGCVIGSRKNQKNQNYINEYFEKRRPHDLSKNFNFYYKCIFINRWIYNPFFDRFIN
jgi:hypothetical protein